MEKTKTYKKNVIEKRKRAEEESDRITYEWMKSKYSDRDWFK